MLTNKNNSLPRWIWADRVTLIFDKKLPSKRYLEGLEYAKKWQYTHIENSPELHTWNKQEFLRKQEAIYTHVKSSDSSKAKLKTIKKKFFTEHESSLWDGAPLQWLSYEVGNRLMTGLYAEAKLKNDLSSYYSFKHWFETCWLKKADEVSLEVLSLGRGFTRTSEMMHIYETTLLALSENIKSGD